METYRRFINGLSEEMGIELSETSDGIPYAFFEVDGKFDLSIRLDEALHAVVFRCDASEIAVTTDMALTLLYSNVANLYQNGFVLGKDPETGSLSCLARVPLQGVGIEDLRKTLEQLLNFADLFQEGHNHSAREKSIVRDPSPLGSEEGIAAFTLRV